MLKLPWYILQVFCVNSSGSTKRCIIIKLQYPFISRLFYGLKNRRLIDRVILAQNSSVLGFILSLSKSLRFTVSSHDGCYYRWPKPITWLNQINLSLTLMKSLQCVFGFRLSQIGPNQHFKNECIQIINIFRVVFNWLQNRQNILKTNFHMTPICIWLITSSRKTSHSCPWYIIIIIWYSHKVNT